jgi:prepilin-type N-terminal cleavage/methylation domain-containing protein
MQLIAMGALRGMKRKGGRHQEGFTLIELLVALTIFSFAVLGLAIGTVSIAQTNNTSHLNAAATNSGQAKLEELGAMSSAAFSSLSCPTYISVGCSDAVTASGKSFARSWMITANSPVTGVTKVDVKIDWTDYLGHSLTFTGSH